MAPCVFLEQGTEDSHTLTCASVVHRRQLYIHTLAASPAAAGITPTKTRTYMLYLITFRNARTHPARSTCME
jgi:hypothetical protein